MLLEFLKAAFATWVEKVGIILAIIPFIEKIPRVRAWLNEKALLDRFVPLLWVVGAFCIVWGFYVAWKDQYNARVQAEKKLEGLTRPKLIGVMDQLVAGNTPELGGIQVFVVVSIKNDGAPSIAQAFQMRIKADSYDATERPTFIPEGFKLIGEGGKILAEFHEADTWQRKAETAITQGVRVRGWLRFVFKGISADQLQTAKNRIREVYFKDIKDQEYTVTDKTLDTSGILYYPGAGTPFRQQDRPAGP